MNKSPRPHPLDPLTGEEINLTSKIIREKLLESDSDLRATLENGENPRVIFNSITLKEPEKSVLLPKLLDNNWNHNRTTTEDVIPRKSFSVLIEKGSGKVFEVVVNLTEEVIEKWKTIPEGYQPTLSPEDCFDSERIAKDDVRVVERCKSLGYNDMNLVVADPW